MRPKTCGQSPPYGMRSIFFQRGIDDGTIDLMVFRTSGNFVSACLCSLLLGSLGAISIRVGSMDSTHPSTKRSTTTTTSAPAPPTPETISVEVKSELGTFAPRARGVLRPMPSAALPENLLAQLGVVAKGPAMLVTLGDTVKFDGAFPGQNGNWGKWDQGVETLVRKHQAVGGRVVFEVWKEPDNGRPFKDRLDFFAAYVHTARKIRKFAPTAVLAGPGTLKFDGGWVSEFLKVCKEYDVLPPIVSWDEDGLKHDLAGHIGAVGESFWQDGTNLSHVILSANAAIDGKQSPGDPAIFLGQLERSIKSNGFRRITQEFEFKLTHLFTNEQKPRSIFFAYQRYAAMEGAGAAVKVNGSGTVDGVAVFDAKARAGKLLLGRNRSRVDAKQTLGVVTLQLKGLAGAMVHVKANRIADSGGRESKGPEAAMEQELAIKNGEISLALPDFATGDAYWIEFAARGETPLPKPSATASAKANDAAADNKGDSAR